MSTVVDERVVEMRFDNRNFEQNIAKTMSTLDKFKAKLKIGDSAKGLEKIGVAAKKVDLSSMGSAVDTLHSKFSKLEVIGVTALANLTNSAVNYAKRLTKAVAIDPITTGFSEYETKINSIQTIMSNTASKGTTMEDVTRVIDELNTYADKTIYNFAEMTRNIGTFTAAGVGLEESAAAIKGIANLAAASGSNSQQASTAMYQLSQALATGTVKLMDWNSVVNAGMGGEKFQEALKATAREYGVAVDEIIERNGSFRDSLHEEWLSAEILNETLNKFTVDGAKNYADAMVKSGKYTKEQAEALIKEAHDMEDAATKVKTFTQLIDTLKESLQSGWGKTWELIFGDFLEARDFFSGLSDRLSGIIDKMSDKRNKLIEGVLGSKWDLFEKRLNDAGISVETFTDKLKEVAKSKGIDIDGILNKYGSIGKAFAAGAFGKKGALIVDTLKAMVGAENKLADATGVTTEKLEYFQDMVKQVVKGDWGNGIDRYNKLTEAGHNYAAIQEQVNNCWDGATLDLTKLSVAQIESMGYTNEQAKALKELAEEAEKTGTPLNELIESLQKPSGRQLLIDSLHNSMDGIASVFKTAKAAWDEIFVPKSSEEKAAQLYKVIEAIHGVTEQVEKFLGDKENIDKLTRTFKGLFAAIDIVATIASGGLRLALTIISRVLSLFGFSALDVTANIGDMIVALRDWIDAHNPLNKAIDFLAPRLGKAVKAIKNFIEGAKEAENIPEYIINGLVNGLKYGISSVVGAIGEIAKSIITTICDILQIHSPSQVMFDLGGWIIQGLVNGIQNGIKMVKDAMGNVTDGVKDVLSKFDFGAILSLGLGVGLLLFTNKLSNVVEKLASPFDILGDLVDGFTDTLSTIGKTLKATAFEKRTKGLLNVAIAIGVLAASLYVLSKIDSERLWESVGVLFVLSATLAALMVVVSLCKGSLSMGFKATAILGITAGLLLIAIALHKLSAIKMDDIPRILLILGIAVGTIVVLASTLQALVIVNGGKSMDKVGALMLKMTFSLLLMIAVFKLAAKLDLGEIKRGTLVIGLSTVFFMLMIKLFRKMHTDAGKYADKAGKLLVRMSISLIIMIGVIKLAGMLSLGEIKRGALAVGAIGLLFAALIGISKLSGEHAAKAGLMIMLMSSSFLILTLAMHALSKLDDTGLERGAKAIAVMGIVFTALIGISKLAGKHAAKAGVMLILMSTSLVILTGLIYIIGNMDPNVIKKGVAALGILMIFMGALIGITHFAADCKGTLITLTVAISLLVVAMITLSFIKPERLAIATAALSMVIGIFALLVFATKSLSNMRLTKSIPMLIILMAVVAGLAVIISKLSKLNPKQALLASSSLSLLLLSLSASMWMLAKMQNNVTAKTIGKVALLGLVFAELAGVLWILTTLKVDACLPQIASLSVLLIALSVASNILSRMRGNVSVKTIGKIALLGLVFAELAGVLWILTTLKADACLSQVLSISILLVVLSGVFVVLSKFGGNGRATVAAVGNMLLLTIIVAELGLVLAMITALKADACLPQIQAIVVLLTVLTGVYAALTLITRFANNGKIAAAIGCLALLSVVVGLLVGILWLIKKAEIGNCIEQVKALSILLAAMSGVLLILAVVGTFAGPALAGVGVLAVLAVALGLAIIAFNKFVAPTLPGLAMNLSLFAMNLMPFCEMMAKVNDKTVSGAKNIADCILALAQANIANSIAGIFGGKDGFAKMGDMLLEFGDYIVAFSNKINGINVEAVNAAANAGMMLATLAENVPSSGGKLEEFFGTKDISAFGEQCVVFGESLARFAKIVSSGDINPEAVQAASDAGTMLCKLAEQVPNSGGLLGDFFGNNDIDTFGTMLVSFGNSLKTFCETVSGDTINADSVEAACKAGEMLTALADTVPNSGGKLGEFFGNNDIDTFGEKLVPFAESLIAFSNKVKGNIDEDAVEAAASAGTLLAKLAQEIPNEDGFVEKIFGNNDMKKFGEKLKPFGESMVAFSNTVTGKIDKKAVEAAAAAGETLARMAQTIPADCDWADVLLGNNDIDTFGAKLSGLGKGLTGFSDATNGLKTENISKADDSIDDVVNCISSMNSEDITTFNSINMATFKTQLSTLGSALKSYGDNLQDVDVERLTSATNQLTKLVNALKSISSGSVGDIGSFSSALSSVSNEAVGKFIAAFQNSGDKADVAVSALTRKIVAAFKQKSNDFTESGKDCITVLAKGMTKNVDKAVSAISSILTKIKAVVKDYYGDMKDAGKYLVMGFASGISESSYLSTQKAKAVAKAAKDAIDESLGIASPAKETYKSGRFAVLGFANALNDYSRLAYTAGKSVAENAKEGLTKAASRISDAVNNIDDQPVIRPVLDMSNVESGVAYMGRMFNMSPSVGLMGRVSAIDTAMNATLQNGFNNDVISAINKLGNSLGNIGGDTYQINGVTYDDGSNIHDAVRTIVRAARIERRS